MSSTWVYEIRINNAICVSIYINQIFNITNGSNCEYAHMVGFVLYDEIEEIYQVLEKNIQEFLNDGKRKCR